MVVDQFERKLMKCVKCEYDWLTTSKLMWVSCPNCGSKNRTQLINSIDEDCEIKEDNTNEEIIQITDNNIR